MTEQALMSIKEVADKLNVSKTFVSRLISNGQLKAFTLGLDRHTTRKRKVGAYRISQQQLDEYLAENIKEQAYFDVRGMVKPMPKPPTNVVTISSAINKVMARPKKKKRKQA